ncbi:MAG: hypothetical protein KDC53_24665, partial [Saprospiraceae bacterium]|nr:hypothetical protein [Saprospiraceae bacterium]
QHPTEYFNALLVALDRPGQKATVTIRSEYLCIKFGGFYLINDKSLRTLIDIGDRKGLLSSVRRAVSTGTRSWENTRFERVMAYFAPVLEDKVIENYSVHGVGLI